MELSSRRREVVLSKLIYADKLIARYCEENCGIPRQECERVYECDACDLVKEIEKEPAVDAELVRHGEWIDTPIGTIECSECGCGFNLVGMFTHYCPNCGTKMDKKQNANAKVKVIYMITLER